MLKQDDVYKALLAYRSTPIPSLGASPAEIALSRKLRTTLPTLPQNLEARVIDHDNLRAHDEAAKERQKANFDRRRGARPLPELHPGDNVLVKLDGERGGWKREAKVLNKCAPRSYILQTPTGNNFRRNRKHLRLYKFPCYSFPSSSKCSPTQSAKPPSSGSPAGPPTPLMSPASPPVQPSPSVESPGTPQLNTGQQLYRTRYGRHVRQPVRFLYS